MIINLEFYTWSTIVQVEWQNKDIFRYEDPESLLSTKHIKKDDWKKYIFMAHFLEKNMRFKRYK